MESIAYYDGKIGAPEELMVPFNDRVHFFGDGCYDATVGANGKVYLLQDHLDRFFTSAKALDINIPMSKAELGRLLTDLLARWTARSTLYTGRSPAVWSPATMCMRKACPASCGFPSGPTP